MPFPIAFAALAGMEVYRGIRTAIDFWGSPSIPEAQREAEIKGIRQTVASYGRALPIIIGTIRSAVNVIWMPAEAFAHVAGSDLRHALGYEFWALSMGLAIGEGPILGIGGCWKDGLFYKTLADLDNAEKASMPGDWHPTGAISALFTGTIPGPASWTTGLQMDPSVAARYATYPHSGAAWLFHVGIGNGAPSASGPNYQFEVQGHCLVNGQKDANAADVLTMFVTDWRKGLAFDSTRLHAASVAALRNYAGALGFGISWAITEQSSTLDLMRLLLDACNCSAVDSGGQVKVLPYGDTDVTANGYTYAANNTPVYTLGDDDFIVTSGQQPIRVVRRSEQETPNCVPVEFLDTRAVYSQTSDGRASNAAYEKKVIEAPLMADATKTLAGGKKKGVLRSSPVSLPCFTSKDAAQTRSKLYAQRSVYVRNTYTFRMSWRGILLEKGDLIRIASDAMGLSERVVRVIGRRRDRNAGEQGEIEITAEDSPLGTYHASAYTIEEGDGSAGLPVAVTPSSVSQPVLFMPPRRDPDGNHSVWVAAAADSTVGRIECWTSWDGTTYAYAGDVGLCTYGTLGADLAAGPPIDGTNALRVALMAGALFSATAADRDSMATACYVDGEIISYATAALVSGSTYDLTSLARGALGSTVGTHATGSPFVRMDDAPIRIAVPDSRRGQTLYVKCLSWNQARTQRQALSDAITYTYSVPDGYAAGSAPLAVSWEELDLGDWKVWGAGASTRIETGTGGVWGGKTLLVTGPALLRFESNVPVDPAKVYALRTRYRQVADPAGGTKLFTAGLSGVAADGATIVAKDGTASDDGFHAGPAGVSNVAGDGWHVYTYYWSGAATPGTDGAASIDAPGALNAGARYVRLTLGLNGGSTSGGVTEVDAVEFYETTTAVDQVARTGLATRVATYWQTAAPTGGIYTVGDLWFDTDDANRPYRWSGTAWVDVRDALINSVQTLAGSKVRVFYQPTAPTATGAGDVWFDTSTYVDTDGRTKTRYDVKQWDGSAWTATPNQDRIVAKEIAAGSVTANSLSGGAVTTSWLNFTPAKSDNIIGIINTSTETGSLRIASSRISIDGSVTFSSGYDPTTKETPSGAQAKADTAQTNATNAAASDATTKANTAQSNAQGYADGAASTARSNAVGDVNLQYGGARTTTTINGAVIQTGTVYANALRERIPGSGISIDGNVLFSSGYDPTTKETPAGAQAKADTAQSNATTISSADATVKASNARTNAVGDVKTLYGYGADTTKIDGGKIYTQSITSAQVASGAIEVVRLTAGSITDNLWPNPTSEEAPPTGADTSAPEWAGRVQVADAYAGNYVRQITAGALQGGILLDKPCSPGDVFTIRAQARRTAGGGNVGVFVQFFDANGGVLSGTDLGGNYWTTNATWTTVYKSAQAPAGAVKVRFYPYADANTTGQYDAIYARRMTDANSVVPLAWTAAVLQSGWSGTLAYTRDIMGVVRLRGTLMPSAANLSGVTAFTIPAGYRPSTLRKYEVPSLSLAYPAVVAIEAAGTVSLEFNSATAGQSHYLDVISYCAEQ